ncbi:MAG: ribosome-associated translation inhibitor RaiA [Pseudonocardiales bacterium]|nr:MAG: ribosome-associated translation inhibitor RaiA [Pseudonocardiales bacterium]
MEIAVKGRNVEVPEHYRQHCAEKLGRVERYDRKLIRIDVELFHEPNPRQSAVCQRVEITCKSRGPVVRSEACAETFYAAFDKALEKLQNRLRRSADRRRVHHGLRTPTSVAAATADATDPEAPDGHISPAEGPVATTQPADPEPEDHTPGLVVREKEHPAKPMSIEQALFEMELVGHDFYLFADSGSGKPSVVYRRKGYDYGVIRLVG